MSNQPSTTSTPKAPSATETDQNTPEVPEVTPKPDEAQEPDDNGPGREAAKYRRALRDAEAERDGLADQLAEARRQMVEDASGLTKPAALWAAGITVDELFTDGHLDKDALDTAVITAADTLGLARQPRTPKADPSQGSHGPGAAPTGRAAWDSALRQ